MQCICLAYLKIHLSDSLIHLHGPRNNPCSGSNKPPLHSVIVPSSTLDLADDFLRINNTAELPAFGLNTIGDDTFQHVVSTLLIKHIPRSAHSSCGKLLVEILQKIHSNTSNIKSWSEPLNFDILILAKPLRTDSKQNLAYIIKRRIRDFSCDIPVVVDTSNKKYKPQVSSGENLAKLITSKIDDGNVQAVYVSYCQMISQLMTTMKLTPSYLNVIHLRRLIELSKMWKFRTTSVCNLPKMTSWRRYVVFRQVLLADPMVSVHNTSLTCSAALISSQLY